MNEATLEEPKAHVPRRRNFAPEPTALRTHLYEYEGPWAWVCVSRSKGVAVAMSKDRAHWSHAGGVPPAVRLHPDDSRLAFTWTSEDEARRHCLAVLSFADFAEAGFHWVRCDVAQSRKRDDRVRVDETPAMCVSIEACARGAMRLAPLPEHRFDPSMRRLPRTRPKVSVAAIAGVG